jgi:hypothetical protein
MMPPKLGTPCKNQKVKGARCWWLMPVILSYSGDRDLEDCGLKLARANGSWDPISTNPSQTHTDTHTHIHTQKRADGVAQGEDPEWSLSSAKKRSKEILAFLQCHFWVLLKLQIIEEKLTLKVNYSLEVKSVIYTPFRKNLTNEMGKKVEFYTKMWSLCYTLNAD